MFTKLIPSSCSSSPTTTTMSLFSLFYLLLLYGYTSAGPTNRTIDDQFGDSVTGAQVTYTPSGSSVPTGDTAWEDASSCAQLGCFVDPGTSQAFMNSWHHATDGHTGLSGLTASFSFTGASISLERTRKLSYSTWYISHRHCTIRLLYHSNVQSGR